MKTWHGLRRDRLLMGVFLALAAAFIWVDEAYVPDLAGRWASKSCETIASPGGGISRLTRDYVLGEDTWHLDLTFYSDQDCTKKLFALGVDGHYELGAKSLSVTGATQARFAMERLKLTPYTDK